MVLDYHFRRNLQVDGVHLGAYRSDGARSDERVSAIEAYAAAVDVLRGRRWERLALRNTQRRCVISTPSLRSN